MDILEKEKCIQIQRELIDKIQIKNIVEKDEIKTMAGVDLAYWKKDDIEYAVCCIVIIEVESLKVLEQVDFMGKVDFPYIPGCLAFRELPFILEAKKKLQIDPDIYIFDGNGYLHPRHMGIATHAAIYLQKPSIGVAKSYYKIGETDFVMPSNEEYAFTDIIIEGEVYGRVLRTKKDVKPIFISVGNYIDLKTATEIINHCVTKESHIPVPTRLADIETHERRKFYQTLDTLNENL